MEVPSYLHTQLTSDKCDRGNGRCLQCARLGPSGELGGQVQSLGLVRRHKNLYSSEEFVRVKNHPTSIKRCENRPLYSTKEVLICKSDQLQLTEF